jgi:putative transposase
MSVSQTCFPVAPMARVLGVSKAGYYAWLHRPPSAHAVADATLVKRVRILHASSRQTYGPARVHADLRGNCRIHQVSLPAVGRGHIQRAGAPLGARLSRSQVVSTARCRFPAGSVGQP